MDQHAIVTQSQSVPDSIYYESMNLKGGDNLEMHVLLSTYYGSVDRVVLDTLVGDVPDPTYRVTGV